MKLNYLLLLFLAGMLLIACGDDEEPDTDPDCITADITYTNGVSAILNKSCATSPACHASGTNATFAMSNYEEAALASGFGRIKGAINHEDGFKPMPYPIGSDKIDQCDIDKLSAWIDAGAPE